MSKNKISVKRLIQNPFKGKKNASIILITHKAQNLNLIKFIKDLENRSFVINRPIFVRIDEF